MLTCQKLSSGVCVFTIRPNCSFGWTWMKRLFGFLACAVSAVAAYFVAMGAWLVLPFAGLEILIIGAGIYANARWAHRREVVELDGNDLRVFRGGRVLTEVKRLPRHWTRVTLRQDPRGWYPSLLLLECHGHRIEVGKALVESERLKLAEDLRSELSFQLNPLFAEPAPLPQGLDTAGQKV